MSNDDSEGLILVVDDDRSSRAIIRIALKKVGYAVNEAENGAAALAAMDACRPDLVITDAMMPVMDGFTFCEELRKRTDGWAMPVLMATSLDDVASIRRAYDAGATDFITKPFNTLVLSQRVRHMLREKRLVEDLSKSERKNRALLTAIPDVMFRINREGAILEVKEAREIAFGESTDGIVGKTLCEVVPIGVAQSMIAAMERALTAGTTETAECQLMLGGTVHDFEARLVTSGENEALGIVRDITARKSAEKALRESEERYALAMRGATDGLWDWDIRTNEVHYSPRWKAMLGCEEHEIGRSPDEWLKRIHPDDVEQVKMMLNAHLEGVSPHFESEYRVLHKDGGYRWMLARGIAVEDKSGKPYRMAGSQADVTDRRHFQDELLRRAFYDPLTGLANRSLFLDRVEHSLSRVKRTKEEEFCLLFLDLDRFNNINDTLGHIAGDEALVAMARRLESCVRPGDTVARIGRDKFVILLENITTLETAKGVAERVETSFEQPFVLQGREVFIPASIGVLLAHGGYEKPEDLLRDAGIAVYKAKSLGRARHVVFEPSMYQKAVALLDLEKDLRLAIDRKELFLLYQPIVCLKTGNLVALEALIRWRHPERGTINPVDFIPLAEETGLILPIGEWVLREVAKQIKTWKDASPRAPLVAVNVSGHQLREPDFAFTVWKILKEQGISPDSMEIEITESVLMENFEEVNGVLGALKNSGIRLSLDDFGTGYSSLSYLQRFPVQKLKIDRSFVAGLGADRETTQIIKSIIDLAKGLDLEVVAEGVETQSAAAQLKELGCGLGQGFFFSRPKAVEVLSLSGPPCTGSPTLVVSASVASHKTESRDRL